MENWTAAYSTLVKLHANALTDSNSHRWRHIVPHWRLIDPERLKSCNACSKTRWTTASSEVLSTIVINDKGKPLTEEEETLTEEEKTIQREKNAEEARNIEPTKRSEEVENLSKSELIERWYNPEFKKDVEEYQGTLTQKKITACL